MAYLAQDGPNMAYLGAIIAGWIVLAFIPAAIAASKGYSGGGWFVVGLILWPVALIGALTLTAKGTLTANMRFDPQIGRWVSFDNAGKWFWHDGYDWQPIFFPGRR